jgi:hypothetical protein
MTPRVHDVTRTAAALALALMLALAWPLVPLSAQAQEAGGEAEGLGGFTVTGSAAPFSMLFYEPVFPIPVDPGEPHAEATLSYTSSRVETGPSTRAVASSTWPGPAFGDGFATICDCDEEWFVKAEARTPGGEDESEQEIPELKAGMHAVARDFQAVARAGSGESPNEEGLAFGNMRSRSVSKVEGGVTTATTVAVAKGVKLAGGVISIDSVQTTLAATSDGKKASSKGETKVNGLVIGGQGYTVDEDGMQPVADDEAEESVLPLPKSKEIPGADEIRKNLGIEVSLVEHKITKEGADVARRAGGLRITIDTAVLKNQIPLYDLVPPEIAGELAPLLVLAPKIEYILGRAAVRAAATEPIDLDFDLGDVAPPPLDAPGGDVGGDGGGFADTAGEDAALSDDFGTGTEGTGEEGAVDQPLAAGEQTQAASAELPALFGGLPPGLVALGLVMAAAGGRALAGFTGAAMGGAGGALCEQGAPRKAPNLRSL